MVRLFFIKLILLSLFLVSCKPDAEKKSSDSTVIMDMTGENIQSCQNTLIKDSVDNLNVYCRIDSAKIYGITTSYNLPVSLQNQNLCVIVKGKIRESQDPNGAIIISLLNKKDSIVFWSEISAKKYIKTVNSWFRINDTINISSSINSVNAKALKVFPLKNHGSGNFDIDSLTIILTSKD